MFIVSFTYRAAISEVDKYLAEHSGFLREQYEAGFFLASGRKVPRTGGVILARADSRQVLEDILADDPFRRHNIAEYEITEFVPTMTAPEFSFLKQG